MTDTDTNIVRITKLRQIQRHLEVTDELFATIPDGPISLEVGQLCTAVRVNAARAAEIANALRGDK